MKKARENMKPESVVSADGRYPTRRNSSSCSVDIIDNETSKIVAFGVVNKKSTYHPEETFTQTSNLMETEALKRAVEQFEDLEKVTGIVFDGDNKIVSFINWRKLYNYNMY